MADKTLSRVAGLRAYLCQRSERNEDLALSYFRKLYPDTFCRQNDACGADGYVPGDFVLELKGGKDDWFEALFQGLAYQNKGLSFSLVVVACSDFLAIWSIEKLPDRIRDDVLEQQGKAPNKIGKELAKKYKDEKKKILQLAIWHRPELTSPLFLSNSGSFDTAIDNFEKTLRAAKKLRLSITLKNFVDKLGEMKEFFDPHQPIKTVRAFYSMIYGPWDEAASVNLNPRYDDQATLAGVPITDLIPKKRRAFKDFVDKHVISLRDDENPDDFFSRFDEAIDKVDSDFRRKHGIYFTSLHLSKLAMWFVKKHIPELGRNYLVIDPACGSGNLVTNWKSPLELRHKVVSELEPELLYAVENRMKGDQWHNGKFTVVPKTAENRGLNFLDCSAREYIDVLKVYLSDKGLRPDKPIAFLCNPPYRSDDDQAAAPINYRVHDSILQLTGTDASSERYTCFLAQMNLICAEAEDSGFPGDSVLLLFTKAAWLNQRSAMEQIRREMLGSFDFAGGFLVNSKEFFSVKVQFPVAFTIWFHRGKESGLNPDRPVTLYDLSWLKRPELVNIDWQDQSKVEAACAAIFEDSRAQSVAVGLTRERLKDWSGQTMVEFKRNRRKNETDNKTAGGLPRGDRRRFENKKTYGECDESEVANRPRSESNRSLQPRHCPDGAETPRSLCQRIREKQNPRNARLSATQSRQCAI